MNELPSTIRPKTGAKTPGALLLRFHQKFRYGLRTAWYRDVVRPRILGTEPVRGTTDLRCEIHALTSIHDWLNLLWTLKSFYASSGRKYALCVHDDGSLDPVAVEALRHHFPDCRIILRSEADAQIAKVLRGFRRCLEFRNTNIFGPKLFDVIAFLESNRMGLFDSDLLFFKEPAAYLDRVEDPAFRKNVFNPDCTSNAYTVKPQIVREHLGFELQPGVNAGFGMVHKESIRWEWIEEFLTLPGILQGHPWRIEQTLHALCSSRYGVELLPSDYTVYLKNGLGDRPFRHYVGPIRHLMYREGMSSLIRQGLLSAKSHNRATLPTL